jgi:steroid delta-isomerase-like uncharacterized protein
MYQKNLIIALILVTLIFACCPSPSKQLEANKDLVKRFTVVLNSADWEGLDELLTENFNRHCQATPGVQVNTREKFKKLQQSFLTSIPDQKITIEMLIAEGDKVAAYATYSGTQTGPMEEFPITGKSVELKFLSIFRIEEGKIAELWVEWDNLTMLAQLGLFPPPGAPND